LTAGCGTGTAPPSTSTASQPNNAPRPAAHTDNIGGDASNLTLSQPRSQAVRAALVERYAIDAATLTTSGFGASQPKATNDTIEGRARNRRVELVRQ
jgi:outer membrane protein OmpA-like peptidoglycan-associated protein